LDCEVLMSCGISVNDFKRLWEKLHKKTKKKATY